MNPFEFKRSLLACFCLLVCATAYAAADVETSAPSFRMGGINGYPGLAIVEKSDSNILRLNASDPNKISSIVTVVSPSLLFKAKQDANEFSLSYVADIGRYSNSSIDNYVDHNLTALASLGLSTRATLQVQPELSAGHDDRGSTYGGFTAGSTPNNWHSTGLKGSLSYGAEDARGNVVLDLGYADRQYQNHRALTTAYDRKLTDVGGTFYLRVQPKTQLLLNGKYTGIAYADPNSLLSGNELSLMGGVKWEATAQTTGEVRIGVLQKKFDTTYTSYTGASWQGSVLWTPLTYLNVDAVSSRHPVESTLTGSSAIMVSNTGANLGYDLNDRVTLNANGYLYKEDFLAVGRHDKTNIFGLKAEYKFRKWLVGGAEYSNSLKASSDPLNDYTRNIFMLSVRSTLN